MKATTLIYILTCSIALLSGCGGGTSPVVEPTTTPVTTPTPNTPMVQSPGGLYVGYYQEDPLTNPEDPTFGAFSLNLPTNDSTFQGSMFFTYVGCQTSNVGAVAGTKSGISLSGTWSGTLDGLLQSGTFTGGYNSNASSYSGTYVNSGGKQFRDLRPCIQYYIAPNGTWEMFAVGTNTPATFRTSFASRNVAWTSVAGAAYTLVYLLDPVIAQTSGNPVLWQTVVPNGVAVTVPNTIALQAGKEYVAVVGISDSAFKRIAFGSSRFTQ